MNDRTKRATAYLAGRIITSQDISAVYDYASAKQFNFTGEVENNLSIYDYEQKCLINGLKNQNTFLLYHYGNQANIKLEIVDNNFYGIDYATNKRFSGNVTENLVYLYDYQNNHNYRYLIYH